MEEYGISPFLHPSLLPIDTGESNQESCAYFKTPEDVEGILWRKLSSHYRKCLPRVLGFILPDIRTYLLKEMYMVPGPEPNTSPES